MKREKYMDIAKGIAAILVIIGHCNYTNKYMLAWLYTFHMPLFFIINGFFISSSVERYSLKEYTKKKAKSLLIPYLVLSIPTYICSVGIQFLKTKILDYENMIKQFLGILIAWRNSPFNNGMWFILALFIADILIYFILRTVNDNKKIKQNHKPMILFILSLIIFSIGALNTKFVKGFIWNLDIIPICVSFILIGYLLNILNKRYEGVFSNNIIGILMLIFNIIFGYLNYKIAGKTDIYESNLGNGIYYIISAIAGSIFIIYLSKKIKTNKILETIGVHSLTYYALQGTIALPIAKQGMELIICKLCKLNNNFILWLSIIVTSILILEILSIILEKIMPKVFRKV